MSKTEKKLKRILREIDAIASDLDSRGLNSLSNLLDEAGERVEDAAAALEGL